MDFLDRAGEFAGLTCEDCDREIEAHDQIGYDVDLSSGGAPVASVMHWWCYERLLRAKVDGVLEAASIARATSNAVADALVDRAKVIAHRLVA